MRILRLPVALCFGLFLASCAAPAATIFLGVLSYDTFIPAAGDSPGVNAFNLANLTGAFSLPSDFPVADDLTFESAVLTLTLSDASQQILSLGDIGPGFLLDGDGNPVVQVPGDGNFTSAELTATLSPGAFTLFDGTAFTADSTALDVFLTPSTGTTLTADADLSAVSISASPVVSSTPEPGSTLLGMTGLLLLGWRRR